MYQNFPFIEGVKTWIMLSFRS